MKQNRAQNQWLEGKRLKFGHPQRQIQLKILLAFFGLILVFQSSFAAAQPQRCSAIFSNTVADGRADGSYGTFKRDFKHNATYAVEVGNQTDIRNQCSLGTCHLHSWVSLLEQDYAKSHSQSIKVSTHYLTAMYWLDNSLSLLESKDPKEIEPTFGASANVSRQTILKFGLIPDEAWTGPRDFQIAPLSKRINEHVKNIVARAKWDSEREIDSEKRKVILAHGKDQIRELFKNLIGETPKAFPFRGKTYDPKSFLTTFFPEVEEPIVQMYVNSNPGDQTRVIDAGSGLLFVTTNLEQVEKTARDLLDRGMNVYLAYYNNAQFIDKGSGVMSISAFNVPMEAQPMTREQRAFYSMLVDGHAVQLVGYDFDSTSGKVIKWKIKNSWGEGVGDKGYFHMYDDYFRAFVKSITFFRESGVEIPAAQVVTPTQLPLEF